MVDSGGDKPLPTPKFIYVLGNLETKDSFYLFIFIKISNQTVRINTFIPV